MVPTPFLHVVPLLDLLKHPLQVGALLAELFRVGSTQKAIFIDVRLQKLTLRKGGDRVIGSAGVIDTERLDIVRNCGIGDAAHGVLLDRGLGCRLDSSLDRVPSVRRSCRAAHGVGDTLLWNGLARSCDAVSRGEVEWALHARKRHTLMRPTLAYPINMAEAICSRCIVLALLERPTCQLDVEHMHALYLGHTMNIESLCLLETPYLLCLGDLAGFLDFLGSLRLLAMLGVVLLLRDPGVLGLVQHVLDGLGGRLLAAVGWVYGLLQRVGEAGHVFGRENWVA